MKKFILLLMVLILSAGSASAEFDAGSIGCDGARFVAQSEYYNYFSLLSLWEIDRENGEALEYPDFCGCYIVDIRDDGKLVLGDYSDKLIVTDLYGNDENVPLIDDGFIMYMSIFDDRLFYFSNDEKLSVIDLNTYERKTLLEDVWMRFMLVDAEGVWYSDDAGLYLLAEGETEPQMVINSDVSYFQRVADSIYYAAASSGTVWEYSLSDKTQREAIDTRAYYFAFDEEARFALVISRPNKRLYWCDTVQGTCEELELREGERPQTINAMDGVLYVKTEKGTTTSEGQSLYAVYRVEDGALSLVHEEGEQ